MSICRPCTPLIAVCPDDFSGGFVPTPVPTRQRVCNTEQTASCPDGSNPQIVAAGTFCTMVLNPTSASLAQAQADTNAMALAQAQSEVGDCAWSDIVWTCSPFDIANPHVGATTTCTGEQGTFATTAFSPNQAGFIVGTYGTFLVGRITFNYKVGTVTHHNFSAHIVNSLTGPSGLGVLRSEIEVLSGVNFGALASMFSANWDNVLGLGTFDYSHDFTSDGASPKVYEIRIGQSVYCEVPVAATPITHTQSLTGLIKALD